MLRLVAYAPDGVRRFPVHRSELIIGSFPDCDICLPYTGVAQRHARLLYDGSQLRIEDLGSRRGLLVSGRKVKEALLEVLDEIRLGGVTLLVEDVVPGPEKPPPPAPAEPIGPPRITPERMIEHLNRISEWVLADAESRTTSEALVQEVLADFGGGALFLLLGDEENAGVKLVVATDVAWLASGEGLLEQILHHRSDKAAEPAATPNRCFEGELAGVPAWICHLTFGAMDRKYAMMVAFPRFRPDDLGWSPMAALSGFGHLLVLGLVHHVGWYEPILPGHPGQQDLTLDPNLVVGESLAMKQVVEQLRTAVDPPVHVLLSGEPGVGKDLLARSLHLSGPRRHGPFVIASCGGARPLQIEADLFGAEVGAGRGSWSSPTAAPCSWPTGRGRSSSGRGGRSSSAPRPSVSGKAATSRGRRSSTSPTRPERAPSSASSTRCARRTSSGASPRTLTAMPRSGPRRSSSATSRTLRTCRRARRPRERATAPRFGHSRACR